MNLPTFKEPLGFELVKTQREQFFLLDQKFHGEYLRFYPNGLPFCHGFYQNGRLDGFFSSFDDRGNLISKIQYSNGQCEGSKEIYYSNGSLYRLEKMFHGFKEGLQLAYYPNGKVMSELMYKAGILEGVSTLYHPNGMIKRKFLALDGNIISELN